ncbi:hypothetical protein TD95_002801 [Thielaviopsis punctulata]|uniref:Serine/threonine-protein kinase MEC1 n=1 Tax=Thielaviopsis punctulata TaxID=72032 RepID=A0A0F4ZJX1_9PEZI|nr:hypothetical protein TD95_002801 [Thielaviopsis punctulata]
MESNRPRAGSGRAAPAQVTLAEQLVDGITGGPNRSVGSRHDTPSRPAIPMDDVEDDVEDDGDEDDEELRRLVDSARKIKGDPAATPETQLQHNHLLLYAFIRLRTDAAALDTADSAGADQILLGLGEIIKFIEKTLRETKLLLDHRDVAGEFLRRGREPFWVWLVPKIMAFLGHEKARERNDEVEDSLAYMVYTAMQIKHTKPEVYQILEYLKDCVNGLFWLILLTRAFAEISAVLLNPDTAATAYRIDLPPTATLDRICGDQDPIKRFRLQYQLSSPGRLIRQATSFLKVLTNHMLFEAHHNVMLDYGIWILDALQYLGIAALTFYSTCGSDVTPILNIVLSILDSDRFDSDVVRIIVQEKAPVVVSLLCSEVANMPEIFTGDGNAARLHVFLRALIKLIKHSILRPEVGRIVSSNIVPKTEAMTGLCPDFDRVSCLLREAAEHNSPAFKFSYESRPEAFADEGLGKLVEQLSLDWAVDDETEPPDAKRRKKHTEDSKLAVLQDLVYKSLAIELDSESLDKTVIDQFPFLDVRSKCALLEFLSHVVCAADETLDVETDPAMPHTVTAISCAYCLTPEVAPLDDTPASAALKKQVLQALTTLVGSGQLDRPPRPRVVAMLALQKVAVHVHGEELYDLEKSALGLWCLKSLRSSVRELRIAASRTLPLFLRDTALSGVPAHVISRNRAHAIKVLKAISDQDTVHLYETCIMAWGQLGRVLPEFELDPVLVQLVEFLGSPNSSVSAFAAIELRALAKNKNRTPLHLVDPFWKYLSYVTVGNLRLKPQTSMRMAELLNMSLDDLLVLVQRHALPSLVVRGEVQTIQRIAAAAGKSVPQLLMYRGNQPSVMASLMVSSSSENLEEEVMGRLRRIHDGFRHSDLMALIRSELVPTLHEVFKHAASRDPDTQAAALYALKWICNGLVPSRDPRRKAPDFVAQALEQHILGLVSSLTEIVNTATPGQPVTIEQYQCVEAMHEMIKTCKSHVRSVRAQISASLLSVMTLDELRRPALSAWAAMVLNLDEPDAALLLEPTYYVVIQYWPVFDSECCDMAEKMILDLHTKYPAMFEANLFKIPALRLTPKLTELADKLAEKLAMARRTTSIKRQFSIFVERITHENSGVVWLGLGDFITFLKTHQSWLQVSALSERPDDVVPAILRALLDCAARFNGLDYDICRMCTECLGLVGCLDSNVVEANKEQRTIVVLHNFARDSEKAEFGFFLLTEVLLKAFTSCTDTRVQGFLAYAMQELLERCDLKALLTGPGTRGGNEFTKEWASLPPGDREILSTFMNSRYVIKSTFDVPATMPKFKPGRAYALWLKDMAYFLIRNPQNPNAALVFEPLTRLVRAKDTSVAEYLLPYIFCHVVLACSQDMCDQLNAELLAILEFYPDGVLSPEEKRQCDRYYECVFSILDYMMRWVHMRKAAKRRDTTPKPDLERMKRFLNTIPPELIAQRAMACNQYNRALFHLERHIQEMTIERTQPRLSVRRSGDAESRSTRQPLPQSELEPAKALDPAEHEKLLRQLQESYAQIDEPDGFEGISAHLKVLDLDKQMLSNKKAQNWTTAQTWCEYHLSEHPEDSEMQVELLTCLKNSGQYDVLLSYAQSIKPPPALENKISSFAVEAAWATGRWDDLSQHVRSYNGDILDDFNLSIAEIFRCLHNKEYDAVPGTISLIRAKISAALTTTATSSLQACRDLLLQCHVLSDLEMILANKEKPAPADELNNDGVMTSLSRRLGVLGSFASDKSYILGIQRAAMQLMGSSYTNLNISTMWLEAGKVARKAGLRQQAFNCVLHASNLGDNSAILDNAKLLYKEGHSRKAIQMLESAISAKKLGPPETSTYAGTASVTASLRTTVSVPESTTFRSQDYAQKLLLARAHLMVANWMDEGRQTNFMSLRERFTEAARTCPSWEKGHYCLARYYHKVLEHDYGSDPMEQSDLTLSGAVTRVIIENNLRSLNFGTKYLYQALPRVITMWLEFAATYNKSPLPNQNMTTKLAECRLRELNGIHTSITKFIDRLQPYLFYTALPQMVARITHSNQQAADLLVRIIAKVLIAYPRQALWRILPLLLPPASDSRLERDPEMKHRTQLRLGRGKDILKLADEHDRKGKTNQTMAVIRNGEALARQIVDVSLAGDFPANRTTTTTLAQLHFRTSCLPCALVVPAESCLMAKMPAAHENKRKHQPFSGDVVTIHSFEQDVVVLGSMARPRRVTALGSNGRRYKLLIKPHDDLRADQRLIEFNAIINKALKKDAESTRRQLYVRTYAVTPLAENGGIIEWVDGLKALREIIFTIQTQRGAPPVNYAQLESLCKMAVQKPEIFQRDVLSKFPPVLHVWFMDTFPDPTAWFRARLRYTRSCAVMSMVGTILGLGDRHGENILLEEGSGGVFHVDFNCLFEKGRTFTTPERVPFRLTHNMVAAMGIYGVEGPFRVSCELTLKVLRQQKDTLLTVMEAFIYDPTIDLVKDKNKRQKINGTEFLTPQTAYRGVVRRLDGYLPGEMIPMGVEGHADELIKSAVDPRNLAAMYIGWCSFL